VAPPTEPLKQEVQSSQLDTKQAVDASGPSEDAFIAAGQNILRRGQKHFDEIANDFRAMDLKTEMVPFDSSNLPELGKDFLFWSVSCLGIVPLLISTFSSKEAQITAFSLFFALVWGVIFKLFIIGDRTGWGLPLGSLMFTGIVGVNSLLIVYLVLPRAYLALPFSTSSIVSLLGFIFHVGLWEEMWKMIPVFGYLLWRRRRVEGIKPESVIVLGVFSGLGFAAFENIGYVKMAQINAVKLAVRYGVLGVYYGVGGAVLNSLVRALSLVFCHAVWSGIFSYFLSIAQTRNFGLGAPTLMGLAVSATIHGIYDWLQVSVGQPTLAALLAGLSFMYFYGYLVKVKSNNSQ